MRHAAQTRDGDGGDGEDGVDGEGEDGAEQRRDAIVRREDGRGRLRLEGSIGDGKRVVWTPAFGSKQENGAGGEAEAWTGGMTEKLAFF